MASYPGEKNILKFTIRIATPPIVKGAPLSKPWGICSSYVFSLKKGDKVKFSGPYGESFMIEDGRELVQEHHLEGLTLCSYSKPI